MKSSRNLVKISLIILALIISPIISSCAAESGPVSNVWIDFPRQGAKYNPGSPIPITIHVADEERLAEVTIRIGDIVLLKGPPPRSGDPVMAISQEWVPDVPGEYTIEVDLTDEEGLRLDSALVDIIVVGELEAFKPDLAVTDILLVGTDQIECHYENQGAAVLPEGRDIWLDIILGPAESEVPPHTVVNIGTGSSFVNGTSGYVTTGPISPVPSWPHLVSCRIDLDDQIDESDETNNLMMLTLNPGPAPPPIATTETPTYTPTYPPSNTPTTKPTNTPTNTPPPPPPTTQAPPADSSPPIISGMSAAPDRIAELPCAQNTATISVQVSDPSGLDQVKLYYRATKGSITGSWQVQDMGHTGGNNYQLAVGPSQISASHHPYGGLILQYYVKAWDSHGNVAQSSSGNLPLDYCVQ